MESNSTNPLRDSTGVDADFARADHPTQIGPYHIESVLGEGGMGIVYSAKQRSAANFSVTLTPGIGSIAFNGTVAGITVSGAGTPASPLVLTGLTPQSTMN